MKWGVREGWKVCLGRVGMLRRLRVRIGGGVGEGVFEVGTEWVEGLRGLGELECLVVEVEEGGVGERLLRGFEENLRRVLREKTKVEVRKLGGDEEGGLW